MMESYTDRELAHELNKYMMHSAIVAENSSSDFYRCSNFILSQLICNDFYVWLSAGDYRSLRDVCLYTVKIKVHLMGILPCPTNASRANSQRNIEELIAGCENYLNDTIVKLYKPHFKTKRA